MEKVLDVSLPGYLIKNVLHEYFEDQLLVAEFDHSLLQPEVADCYPLRLKAPGLILVLSGEMDIEINYLCHHIKKHTAVQLSLDDILLSISYSADFSGYFVVFSPELRSEIMGMTSCIRLPKSGQMKRAYPVQYLREKEFNSVTGHIERIMSYISDETHLYRSPLIRNEVMSIFWDIDDSRWKTYGNLETDLTHSELLREKFREMLVEKCHQHRDVGFYARELCVTPDYLSKVVRDADGSSAMKWIANAIVVESKFLLRQKNKTIQEVSMELNFPDQSSFGKFFKRHTGKSPARYRREIR